MSQPNLVIYDANGQPVQVGDRIRGTHPGTVQNPGNKSAVGVITQVNQRYAYIAWRSEQGADGDMAYANLDHKSGRYILAGETGTWERGFQRWAIVKVEE